MFDNPEEAVNGYKAYLHLWVDLFGTRVGLEVAMMVE